MLIFHNFKKIFHHKLCTYMSNICSSRNLFIFNICFCIIHDLTKLVHVTMSNERIGNTFSVRTACTSDTMYIVFHVVWKIIVKYRFNIFNIKTSGCNVCRDKDFRTAFFKCLHNPVTLRLFHITVKTFCLITSGNHFMSQFIDTAFCITEDHG